MNGAGVRLGVSQKKRTVLTVKKATCAEKNTLGIKNIAGSRSLHHIRLIKVRKCYHTNTAGHAYLPMMV